MPYKGRLSESDRAVAQRDKARLRNEEQQALHAAGNADRAAKHQAKKKLKRQKSYQAMSRAAQRAALKTAQEAVEQKRLINRQSGTLLKPSITVLYLPIVVKWLRPALAAIHEKWAEAPLPTDPRRHSKVLEGASVSKDHPGAAPPNRAALRIYGGGGALELIMRNTYRDGFANLQANSFESQEAKKEWTDFVARLEPSELVMVKDEHWRYVQHIPQSHTHTNKPRRREPESVLTAMGLDDNTSRSGNRAYDTGAVSDECEEELDDDAESNAYHSRVEDKYETDDQWKEAAAEEEEGGTGQDEIAWGSDTDFEGFSDD